MHPWLVSASYVSSSFSLYHPIQVNLFSLSLSLSIPLCRFVSSSCPELLVVLLLSHLHSVNQSASRRFFTIYHTTRDVPVNKLITFFVAPGKVEDIPASFLSFLFFSPFHFSCQVVWSKATVFGERRWTTSKLRSHVDRQISSRQASKWATEAAGSRRHVS